MIQLNHYFTHDTSNYIFKGEIFAFARTLSVQEALVYPMTKSKLGMSDSMDPL